jgi:hypothetical protein
MTLDRKKLYKFPWSKTDNPGAWIEVTDRCDLSCPGCFRHRIEGDRPIEELKEDILLCKKITNCDRIAIAGGEPLLYPHLIEVVDFIAKNDMKPMILTNGESLTLDMAKELKKAGLFQYYFHVDSGQKRPGWEGKNEIELNALRERFAQIAWDSGRVQCGYNITVFRSTLKYINSIIEWGRKNIDKVQHISLITFRGLHNDGKKKYFANGKQIDLSRLKIGQKKLSEINIGTEEIYDIISEDYPMMKPSAYLAGSAKPETYKFLIIINLGSKKKIYGVLGRKTVELNEISHHLRRSRYQAGFENPKIGKKIYLLSLFDKEVRKSLGRFLLHALIRPAALFDSVYLQCVNIQQPNEFIDGEKNLCDGCVNMMIYNGDLIHSCQLDEYRFFGGPIQEIKKLE